MAGLNLSQHAFDLQTIFQLTGGHTLFQGKTRVVPEPADEVQANIRLYDKLLVVLSEASMRTDWVATEIRTAPEEERQTGKQKLFPIRLVDFDKLKLWEMH